MKKNIKLSLIIVIMLFPLCLFSQTNGPVKQLQYNYTVNFVFSENFTGAIRLYKQMLSFAPKNPVYHYKLGFAYLNTYGKQDSAIMSLNSAKKYYSNEYKSEISLLEIQFYLARAYRLVEKIDSCIILLETLKTQAHEPQFITNINNELELSKKFYNNHFLVQNLDSSVNSSFSEHSPVFFSKTNTLMFTSRRFDAKSTRYEDGQYAENIYSSTYKNGKWSKATLVAELSTNNNEASTGLTAGQKKLIIYKDENNGSIFFSDYNNGKWQEPQKYPKPINTRHRETHASITEDGKTMFFTSDRPGGLGGTDIWMSKKENGKWLKPVNLGKSINSEGDEESPNIMPDGKTIYFSSNGRKNGFGGFDIYVSKINEFNTWGMAQNIGYPINSIGDDIFFMPIQNENKAFYASYRSGNKGNADIFIVYLNKKKQNSKIINYGFLVDTSNKPFVNADIIIENNKSKIQYFAKPTKNGKFIFVTEPNNSYKLNVVRGEKILFSDKISKIEPEKNKKEVFYKKITINKP